MIIANVIPGSEGLTITFTAKGDDEARVRQMFDTISDDGNVSKSMEHVLRIAVDAVDLISKHQDKVYP